MSEAWRDELRNNVRKKFASDQDSLRVNYDEFTKLLVRMVVPVFNEILSVLQEEGLLGAVNTNGKDFAQLVVKRQGKEYLDYRLSWRKPGFIATAEAGPCADCMRDETAESVGAYLEKPIREITADDVRNDVLRLFSA